MAVLHHFVWTVFLGTGKSRQQKQSTVTLYCKMINRLHKAKTPDVNLNKCWRLKNTIKCQRFGIICPSICEAPLEMIRASDWWIFWFSSATCHEHMWWHHYVKTHQCELCSEKLLIFTSNSRLFWLFPKITYLQYAKSPWECQERISINPWGGSPVLFF